MLCVIFLRFGLPQRFGTGKLEYSNNFEIDLPTFAQENLKVVNPESGNSIILVQISSIYII